MSALWVESFAAYAYCRQICLLEFVIVDKLKRNKKFQRANSRLYAYAASDSTLYLRKVSIQSCAGILQIYRKINAINRDTVD